MNPIRREVLNGLFVLVLSTLLSVGFTAFQISLNVQLWVWIVIGVSVAVGFYVVFELTLGFMASSAEATRLREEEWLKRVGNPARLALDLSHTGAAVSLQIDAVKALKPGSDLTIMLYLDRDGATVVTDDTRKKLYDSIVEQLRRGTIREYKRLICFDPDVFASDRDLQSGVLRVGTGPGTLNRSIAEHCRLMIENKGCSVFVAPVIMRNYLALWGADKASISVDTVDRETGARAVLGVIFFYDPPNGEIIERFQEVIRETEKRMVAVRKICFPEDVAAEAKLATG